MSAGFVILLVMVSALVLDRAMLSTTPAPRRAPMTDAQIEAWHDEMIYDAFAKNVSISYVGADDEDEEEVQLNPAFDAWAKEQTVHIISSLTGKQRDTFIETGRLPRGFSYTRVSPACLLEDAA